MKRFWHSLGLRIGAYGERFAEAQGFVLVLLSWSVLVYIAVSKHLSAQGTLNTERLSVVESRQQMVLESLKDLKEQDITHRSALDSVEKEIHDLGLAVARLQTEQAAGDMNMYVMMFLIAANLGDSGLRRISDWRKRILSTKGE